MTARHVRWMFAGRLAGRSVSGIARELNEPSGADPERNRHRSGQVWNLRSVAVILANPRYTSREVWHRHQSARQGAGRRINTGGGSGLANGGASGVGERGGLPRRPADSGRSGDGDGALRRYLLAGLLIGGLCGRRMDAHWVNGRPGYRCRHGHSSARPGSLDRPRNLYVRGDVLLVELVGRFIVDGAETASSASDMAACLRSRAMAVVHDRTGWSLVDRNEP